MSDIKNSANWSFETKQLHIGQEQADPVTDARAVPIYATTSFVFHNSEHAQDRFGLRDAGNIYGRLTNPTQSIFEERIAALENGTAALAVASGAAAITYTFQALAKAGEHIVANTSDASQVQDSRKRFRVADRVPGPFRSQSFVALPVPPVVQLLSPPTPTSAPLPILLRPTLGSPSTAASSTSGM